MTRPLPRVIPVLAMLAAPVASQEPATAPLPELGAANWVPADSACFTRARRLGEQWARMCDSNAFRQVLALPAVKMGPTALQASPPWRQLETLRDDDPDVDAAVEVLGDAVSQEVFACFDGRWVPVRRRAGERKVQSLLPGLRPTTLAQQLTAARTAAGAATTR